jgi:hypothetical protein
MIKSRRMRWSDHIAQGREENCIQTYCGKIRRKETTRKAYTYMDLKEIGYQYVDWIHVAHGRDQ